MQFLYRSSERGSDVCCPVCGQGFLMYWTRRSPQEQAALVSVVMDALGRQHALCAGPDAHHALVSREEAGEVFAGTAECSPEPQWGYC